MASGCESRKYVLAGLMTDTELAQGHVAGPIFSKCFFFFFSVKKMSQPLGAELVTREW